MPLIVAATGIALFSLMDAALKSASLAVGVYTALLLRCAVGAAVMLPVWLARGGTLPRGRTLRLHALRSSVVACMAPLFFWGLVRMPMAEAMALSFIAPLIALYLASILLHERIHPSAVVASLFGLAGVIVIALGRFGEEDEAHTSLAGVVAVLASAVFYAWNLVLQRQQALVAGPADIALFQSLFVGLLFLPWAPWLFVRPDSGASIDIALGGMLSIGSLMLLSWGYARAEAQALIPVEYTGFLWAALFGWIWFAEPLTPATLAGAALIIGGNWIAARKPAVPARSGPPAP